MSLPQYLIVRVNDDETITIRDAFDSFQWHYDNGLFLTRHANGNTGVEAGQKLIGAGCYGGRGMVIFGTVTGEWESRNEPWARYKRQITVQWERGVYAIDIAGLDSHNRMALSKEQYEMYRRSANRISRRSAPKYFGRPYT